MSAAAVFPAAARAGAWAVVSCATPAGAPAATDGWSTTAAGTVGPGSGDSDTCPDGGALTALTSGESTGAPYDGPGWRFTAPAGSTIAGGTVTAALTSPHGQAWLATPGASYDAADVIANCQYNEPCGTGGTLTAVFPITHTGGTSLYAQSVCVAAQEGATVCPAYGGADASVSITAADIVLANDATPAASGFGGSLLEPAARGTADLAFTATDPEGPGVQSVAVQADGVTLTDGAPDSDNGSCTALPGGSGPPVYESTQPCRQTVNVDEPVDTTALADGPHELKVTVTDAAGNASVVYDGTITTRNAPVNSTEPVIAASGAPAVGTPLTSSTGVWSSPAGAGANVYSYRWEACDAGGGECHPIAGADGPTYTPGSGDTGRTLRVTVTAADSDGSAGQSSAATAPVTALPALAASIANGEGATGDARLTLDGPAVLTRSYAGRALVVAGRLVSSAGRPIGGATLEVAEQQRDATTVTALAPAVTSPGGWFTVRVPAGPSRRVTVGYRAFTGEPADTARLTVTENVTAAIHLDVTPARTAPDGAVLIGGRLAGPVPAGGVIVTLLVHYRGRWEPFRTARAAPDGTFHVRYRFEGAVGRFPFRAVTLGTQAGYPYAPGVSAAVAVTTR